MNAKDADFVFKVVIIGDSNVGKTTLLKKYIGEQRLGEDFGKSVINNHTLRQPIVKKKVERNSVKVSLEIHDTMGQERFRSLTRSYYRGAHGCFICFDVNNPTSFDNLKMWLRDVKEIQTYDHTGIVKILVGINSQRTVSATHCSISTPDTRVPVSRAKDFAVSNDLEYLEVNLDYPRLVENCFIKLVEMMIQSRNTNTSELEPNNSISLHEPRQSQPSQSCWC